MSTQQGNPHQKVAGWVNTSRVVIGYQQHLDEVPKSFQTDFKTIEISTPQHSVI
jgi:hypothetical protein